MLRPVLRRLHSPDVDLYDYRPADPERFGILVQAEFGPAGGQGGETFDFVVCSPNWFGERLPERGMFVRHHLFLPEFDIKLLEARLAELCDQAAGADWAAVASYLSRFGQWEFEDYRESEPPR